MPCHTGLLRRFCARSVPRGKSAGFRHRHSLTVLRTDIPHRLRGQGLRMSLSRILLLSLLLYRFGLSENIVSIGITGIYVLATFLSGFLAGKREQTKRFLWGLLMGLLYFLLLSAVSLIVDSSTFSLGRGF